MGTLVGYAIVLVLSTGISLPEGNIQHFFATKQDCLSAVQHLTAVEKRALEGGFGRQVFGYRCVEVRNEK